MKIRIYSIILISIFLISCYQSESADLIIHNAKIYTCNTAFTTESAMAIKDGKIMQIGPEREILNGYDCDEIIDAEMRPVFPGFYDAHCHFLAYANTFNEVNLSGLTSFSAILNKLKEFDESNSTSWITGRGWDQNLWEDQEFPNNESISILFPNKPVFITRVDGHAALANNKALELAKINAKTTCFGGEILLKDGKLTGLLIDNALDLVKSIIPKYTDKKNLESLKKAELKLFEQGLTSINDAGVNSNLRANYIKWYTSRELSINNYLMLFPDAGNMEFATKHGEFDSSNLHINSFKLISDGALGSRGACLLSPYSDHLNHSGKILQSEKNIRSIANLANNTNFQLNSHCIGDSANRLMLNIYKDIIGNVPDHRWKIEHAQVLSDNEFSIFEYLGVIPSVQPTHYTSDMDWAIKRLGNERMENAYAYKSLLKKAKIIALGTDFPIENISTMETFYAAVSRTKKNSIEEKCLSPNEKLSRKEALLGMTRWAAYSNFEEHQRGSLEAGKNADFVILTKDIMEIPEANILNTFIYQTFLNGKIVYTVE